MNEKYAEIGFYFGFFVFVGVWIASFAQWGFLIGIGFGWIPALVAAILAFFSLATSGASCFCGSFICGARRL